MTDRSPRLMECHGCGLGRMVSDLPDGTAAGCIRCDGTLRRVRSGSLDRAFAWTCTGLVLLLMANTLPFLSLEISGRMQSASLLTTWPICGSGSST